MSTAAPAAAAAAPAAPDADEGAAPSLTRTVGIVERPAGSPYPSNEAIIASKGASEVVGHRSDGLDEYDFALANRRHVLVRKGEKGSWRAMTREAMGNSTSTFAAALQYVGLAFGDQYFRHAYWHIARGSKMQFDRTWLALIADNEEDRLSVMEIPDESKKLEGEALRFYNEECKQLAGVLSSVEAATLTHKDVDVFQMTGEARCPTTVLGAAGEWRFCFHRHHDAAPWFMEFQYHDVEVEEGEDGGLPEDGLMADYGAQPPPPPSVAAPPPAAATAKATGKKRQSNKKAPRASSNKDKKTKRTREEASEIQPPSTTTTTTAAAAPAPDLVRASSFSSTASFPLDAGLVSSRPPPIPPSVCVIVPPPPKRARIPSVARFHVVLEPATGMPVLPLSIAICEDDGHIFVTQDIASYWDYFAPYMRSMNMDGESISKIRQTPMPSRPAIRIELITKLDESGAAVPMVPTSVFVRHGTEPSPFLLRGADLAPYQHHVMAILYLMGASQDLAERTAAEMTRWTQQQQQ